MNNMETLITGLATDFPKAYRHALTHKAIRMLLSNERHIVKQMQNTGMISDKDAAPLLDNIDERADELNAFNHTIPASILRWLFSNTRKTSIKN